MSKRSKASARLNAELWTCITAPPDKLFPERARFIPGRKYQVAVHGHSDLFGTLYRVWPEDAGPDDWIIGFERVMAQLFRAPTKKRAR